MEDTTAQELESLRKAIRNLKKLVLNTVKPVCLPVIEFINKCISKT